MLALDTNILIALQKLEPAAFGHDRQALMTVPVVIPSVVRYEARRSLLAPQYARRLAQLDQLLSGHATLDFDQQAADIAADIYHQLRTTGQLIDEADLMIAALSIQHGAALVTRNTSHFQHIPGLTLLDWL